MTRSWLLAATLLSLSACEVIPKTEFIASKKSPLELRAMQTRLVPGDDNSAMRGAIATLHGLGYRITRAEVDAGTVSGTRSAVLRMAVVVRQEKPGQSVMRANATILGIGREAQVDDPEFYSQNFFIPLTQTIGRQLGDASDGDNIPDAVRPTAEINSARERKAAAVPAVATKTDVKP